MAFVPVVKLTDEIEAKIEATAKSFCEKYGVSHLGDTYTESVRWQVVPGDANYSVWLKRFRRACGSNCVTGTGWGYAGYNTEN